MANSSNSKLILKNTLFMYMRMFVLVGIGLYTSRVVLQVLGVVDYGIYNVVGGIVSLFIFLNGALSHATQRFIAYDLGKGDIGKLKNTFSMCINVHIIIALIIFLLADTIGLWIVYNKLVIPEERFTTALWVYHFSILSSLISICQVPFNATINAHEKFNVYAIISIIDAILKLLVVFLIQYLDRDHLLAYGFGLLAIHFFQAFLYILYCIRKFSECSFRFFWDRNQFSNIFNYTSWSLIGNIADILSDQGINILLNMFFGPAVNAARGFAVQIKTQVAAFVMNFQAASNPQIVKDYAVGEKDKMIELVIRTSKMSFFLFFTIMFPLCLEMESILDLWLKNPPKFLYEFAIIVLTTVLLQSLGGTLQMAIQASGQIKIYHLTVSVIKLICLPVSYWGLKNGASPIFPLSVVMIVFSCVVGVNIYLVKRIMNFPINRYIHEVIYNDFKVFFIASIVPFLFIYFSDTVMWRIPFTVVITTFSIVLTSYFIGFDQKEKKWIVGIVKDKFCKIVLR